MPTFTLNGFKHYYEDEGSGETLFMLHGALGSAHNFQEHVSLLSHKFRVIVPDMRGMGRSEHVKETPSSAWFDDLVGLMDYLSIDQAHVFGTSLGSRVAMRLGIDRPERVRSLILNSPHIYLTAALDEAQNRVGGDGTELPANRQEDLRHRHGEDWLDVVRNYFNIRNAVALQEYYNFKQTVTKITCPVLAITLDNLGDTFDHAMELKTRLTRAQLAVIPALRSAGDATPIQSVATVSNLVSDFMQRAVPVSTPAG